MAGKWKCLSCVKIKGVTNGICDECGPTQTCPLDRSAKYEAGFYKTRKDREEFEKREAKVQAENAKKRAAVENQ